MLIVKGILCDFFIFKLEQIIVLNKYVPIKNLFPKYHMSKLSRTCVKGDTKNNKKVRNKLL